MKGRTARSLAWTACLLALWLELALLACWVDASTSVDAFALGGVGALLLMLFIVADEARRGLLPSQPGERLAFFTVGLLMTLAFVEIDCGGTLAMIGGRPTCNDFHSGMSVIFTLAAAMVTLALWPNALRLWIVDKFVRPPV